ncbi:MAG: SGNH/GDSL hydrolase family protein [Bdellovibrionales bacterium]|nr:SGNH/GDSL hydrolase family protein [Bdellovibrionales bacterium]
MAKRSTVSKSLLQILVASSLLLSAGPAYSESAKIAYIGDSHSSVSWSLFGRLFKYSDSSLANENIVFGQGVCGAGIHYYLNGNFSTSCGYMETLNNQTQYSKRGRSAQLDLVLEAAPEIVIVQLGGNHSADPVAAEPLVKTLVRQVIESGASCIWIGAAATDAERCARSNYQRLLVNRSIKRALNEMANESGAICDYIDSYELTREPGAVEVSSDCRHYTFKGYQQWASIIELYLGEAIAAKLSVREQ